MDNLTIEPASKADLSEAGKWSDFDSPNSMLTTASKAEASKPSNAHQWAAKQNDQLVGLIGLNIDQDHIGHLSLLVKPTERRQGIGTVLLQRTLELPEVKQALWLQFVTQHGNTAAKRVLREHGFYERFVNEEGSLVFERRA